MDYLPNVKDARWSLNVVEAVHFNFRRIIDAGSKMTAHDWMKQFPAAVTVCDCKGVILDMNDKALKVCLFAQVLCSLTKAFTIRKDLEGLLKERL